MDEQTGMNILERIHASYYQFTSAERRVADFILAQYAQVQFMSITQLADECGTAEATISRFCRRLNLKGFNAFKIELAQYSAGASAGPVEDSRWGQAMDNRLEAAHLACEAVNKTVELLSPAQIEQAVELIERANRVFCFGSGGSMILASECAHLFSTVTGKFFAVSDNHTQTSTIVTMDPGDVIILFSYSGATVNGMQLLEQARAKGVASILVTRYHKSPAAKLASVVLRCGSNESPFQFGSIPARIAQLMVIDLVYKEYYSRNREQCEETVRAIASALSGMHV